MNALAIKSEVTMEGMPDAMGGAFQQLMEFGGAQMTGPPFAIWYKWEGDVFEFDNCIPVATAIPGNDVIKNITTYAGKTVSVSHTGAYETTHHSWAALQEYVTNNNLETNGEPYEVYLTNPQEEPNPDNWITELYWPIK